MWSCDQSLVTLSFLWKKNLNFIKIWPEKLLFFEGLARFKFNNWGLALGTNLKFYTNVAKRLKLKSRKFCGLIFTFAEVTKEKLIGGLFGPFLTFFNVTVFLCFYYLFFLYTSNNKMTLFISILKVSIKWWSF